MTYKEKIIKIQEVLNEPSTELSTEQNQVVNQVVNQPDWSKYPNFKPSEFVCRCGKCELSKPEVVATMINPHLLDFLQTERNYHGKPITITCGVRCKEYNDSLVGSIPNSKHMTGDAADYYIAGVTSTESGRKEEIKRAKASPYYGYSYCNIGGNHKNMGSAVHCDFVR